jgi:hypothetical protein
MMDNKKMDPDPTADFSDIFTKLSYDGKRWHKIGSRGKSKISEPDALKLIVKDWPQVVGNNQVLSLKKYLINKSQKQQQITYSSEEDFIDAANNRHKLFTVTAAGMVEEASDKSAILSRLKLMASQYNSTKPAVKMNINMISDALSVLADNKRIKKLDQIKEKIKFDPALPDRFDELLNVMRVKNHRDINKAAFKHYVWLVKRKLWGWQPRYQMMLILYGKGHGMGKSGVLDQFHAPIRDIYSSITGNNIKDKFGNDLFRKFFALKIDELTALGDVDNNLLKEFVTRDSVTARRMYSEDLFKFQQNVTLSGTTNRPINHVIYDNTGMRRWWQIELDTDKYEKMDFPQLNKWEHEEEFLPFWKNVDENNEYGYYGPNAPLYKEMLDYQNTFRAIPPTEQFIDNQGYSRKHKLIGPGRKTSKEEIELNKIWSDWKQWCKDTYNTPYTQDGLKNKLIEMGFDIIEHKTRDKTTGKRKRKLFLAVDKNSDEDEDAA